MLGTAVVELIQISVTVSNDGACNNETDDYNTINLDLDLNADTIFPDRIYLKRWKDPDKADVRHNEVKEELESAKC